MGFIDRVRKFFSSEEEKSVGIKEENIGDMGIWVENNKAKLDKILKEKINSFLEDLGPHINSLEDNTKKLEEVKIDQNKTEEKIIKITEIGREKYISSLNKLIQNLKIQDEYQVGCIKEKIDEFAKNSAKSDFKVTLLIGKEVEKIRKNIIKMNRLESEFINDNSSLISKINNLNLASNLNQNLKKNEKEKLKIVKEIEKIKKSDEDYKNKLKESEENIKKIIQSPENQKRETLLENFKSKENLLKEVDFKIKTLIDKKVIEKYIYIEEDKTNKKTAQRYMENPIEFIINNEPEIYSILERIKEKINKLNLKEPNKSIEKIESAKSNLPNYKKEIIELNQNIEELKNKIKEIKTSLPEASNEKIKIESRIKETQNKLTALTKKHDKLDNLISDLNADLTDKIRLSRV